MIAGRLRHVIAIQSKAFTTDAWGGQVEAWTNFATGIRAEVNPLSGRELIASQAAQSATTCRFKIRYMAGVKQAMRVVYGGQYYNISAVVDVDGRQRELHLMTETGLNEG